MDISEIEHHYYNSKNEFLSNFYEVKFIEGDK